MAGHSLHPKELSGLISILADDAYGLYEAIRELREEVKKRDGIEAIEYLADVPEELASAENFAEQLCDFLESAEKCAKMGGD